MTGPETVAVPEPALTPPPKEFGAFHRTILEGTVLMLLSGVVVLVFQALQLNIFLASEANAKAIESLRYINPLMLVGATLIAAPVIEEALFRGLPYLLWRRVARVPRFSPRAMPLCFWLLGACGAVLFAVTHGSGSLPVPQLLLGLWSWHVVTVRGFRYSIVLHASYNFLPTIMLLLGLGHAS